MNFTQPTLKKFLEAPSQNVSGNKQQLVACAIFCNCNSGGICTAWEAEILGSTSIVIHSMKQRLLRNWSGNDTTTSRDFLHERL